MLYLTIYWAIVISVVLFVGHQVIYPLMTGGRTFSLFRNREKIVNQLQVERDHTDELRVELEVAKEKNEQKDLLTTIEETEKEKVNNG